MSFSMAPELMSIFKSWTPEPVQLSLFVKIKVQF